jgi:outer membrane receptor protein involved in Fe transport
VAFNLRFKPFSTWAGPVAAATGVEAREESVSTHSNPLSLVSGNSLFNNIPYRGSHDVKEGYVEALIPLAARNAWADEFDLNVAGRITDYSTSGTVETWKVGFTYATPFDLRLRGTKSRDIAAPSLANLFAAGGLGSVLNGGVNPFNGQTGRVSALTGGNPGLEPEVADTWTAGVVYQPEWLPGLGLSIDYYDIEIADVISTPSAADVLNRCAAGVGAYCDLIVTDSSPFGIAYVKLTAANLAERKATGMDIEINYRMNAARLFAALPGDFSLRALGSYVKHLRLIDAGGPVERAGSGVGGLPQWTVNVDAAYRTERFFTNVNLRYFNTLKYDGTLVGPEDPGYDPAAGNSITTNRFPARMYTNWSATLNLPMQSESQLELFVNVNNVFDRNPPKYALPAFFQGGNPYPVRGRFYRFGVRYEF